MSDHDPLALYLTPDAIRDAFDGHDDERGSWVAAATDEQLREVGQDVIGGDILYGAYRAALDLAVDEALGAA